MQNNNYFGKIYIIIVLLFLLFLRKKVIFEGQGAAIKKIIAAIFALSILFSFQSFALALSDSKEYSLDALHMKISIPNNYIVLTRDTKILPEEFAETGKTIEEVQKSYEFNDIYLDAVKDDFSDEIIITMTSQDEVYDFQKVPDIDMETYAKSIVMYVNSKNDEAKGTTDAENEKTKILGYGYKHADEAAYIKLNKQVTNTDSESTTDYLQYYTVKNALAINVVMKSLTGKELTDYQEVQADAIVQTAKYEALPVPSNLRGLSLPEDEKSTVSPLKITYSIGQIIIPVTIAVGVIIVVVFLLVRRLRGR